MVEQKFATEQLEPPTSEERAHITEVVEQKFATEQLEPMQVWHHPSEILCAVVEQKFATEQLEPELACCGQCVIAGW